DNLAWTMGTVRLGTAEGSSRALTTTSASVIRDSSSTWTRAFGGPASSKTLTSLAPASSGPAPGSQPSGVGGRNFGPPKAAPSTQTATTPAHKTRFIVPPPVFRTPPPVFLTLSTH